MGSIHEKNRGRKSWDTAPLMEQSATLKYFNIWKLEAKITSHYADTRIYNFVNE